MVDERTSPSGGWEAVYDAMDADTDAEGPARPCPNCDAASERVFDRVFCCPEHGFWALDREQDVRWGDRSGTRA